MIFPSEKAVVHPLPRVSPGLRWRITLGVCAGLTLKLLEKRPAANTIRTMHRLAGWAGSPLPACTKMRRFRLPAFDRKGSGRCCLRFRSKHCPRKRRGECFPHSIHGLMRSANIQNSMLLLAAFVQARPDLLSVSLHDRIHQPYRSALCPLLPCLQQLTGKPGVLGSALSGAGPSVLVFLDPSVSGNKTRKFIASHLAANGLRSELLPTCITLRGARS